MLKHISLIILMFSLQLAAQEPDTLIIDINNIILPVLSDGSIGGMNNKRCLFDGKSFLWSSGFFMSGITDSSMWSNAVFESNGYRDYIPGKFGVDSNYASNKFFVIRSTDTAFGQSWNDWKSAVSQGAYFYDGDGDGIYNPVDLNGNGEWDENEDRPDLIGDIMAFTVFNDGKPSNKRVFYNINPQGIEIRQSIFAFEREKENVLNNVIFFRYTIKNVGSHETLDSVYFGVAADPDIGDYIIDLTGCDTLLNGTFAYKIDQDGYYGANPPAFMVLLLQGPTIPDSGSSSIIMRGPVLGTKVVENTKLLGMTSSHSHLRYGQLGMPVEANEMRNYLIGGMYRDGQRIDVGSFFLGNGDSLGTYADSVDPKYMFSGDPQKGEGWLCVNRNDWRFVISSGPFSLIKNQPVELIYAYIIARGNDPLNSVTVVKEYSKEIIKFYESNFTNFPVGIGKKRITEISQNFTLFQNYPNPFNPTTTIKYVIPQTDVWSNNALTVKLKIYDVLGREVATLVNMNQGPGEYEINFNAKEMPSGVYFYKLQAGTFVQTKKMILLR